MKTVIPKFLIVFSIISFSACGEVQEQAQPEDRPATTQEHTVSIQDFAFAPEELTIQKGDTVTWTNFDSVAHTITSDEGNELDSELLSKNQTYSHTFQDDGVYPYHCTPHPSMTATIIVNQ